ncbi:GGDEF domain-containing protein [Pseudomonadota bacterium]
MKGQYNESVRSEQARLMYGHTVTGAVSNPLGGAIIVWIFWDVVGHGFLLAWLGSMVLVSLIRIPPYLAFPRLSPHEQAGERWENIYLLTTFSHGLIWSVAWLTFIPGDDPIYLVIAGMWMVGLSASAIIGYSASLKTILSYSIPVLVPGTIHLFIIGGKIGFALGAAIFIYTVVVVRAVKPVNKSIIDAIRLNFELEDEIKQRKKVEEQLREISIKDQLTGLFNRRHFDQVLDLELQRAGRVNGSLSLILIDVDSFKAFNDTYGHVAGDACLQRISHTVEKGIKRSGDLAFRYGGEELAVILPGTNSDSALQIAESIREKVQGLGIIHEGSELPGCNVVTISSGVATTLSASGSSPSNLIHRADSGLYRAKSEGRNRVVVSRD